VCDKQLELLVIRQQPADGAARTLAFRRSQSPIAKYHSSHPSLPIHFFSHLTRGHAAGQEHGGRGLCPHVKLGEAQVVVALGVWQGRHLSRRLLEGSDVLQLRLAPVGGMAGPHSQGGASGLGLHKPSACGCAPVTSMGALTRQPSAPSTPSLPSSPGWLRCCVPTSPLGSVPSQYAEHNLACSALPTCGWGPAAPAAPRPRCACGPAPPCPAGPACGRCSPGASAAGSCPALKAAMGPGAGVGGVVRSVDQNMPHNAMPIVRGPYPA